MNKHTYYGVEIVGPEGPTGTFREVLEAEVQDYGGNVLASGKAGSWLDVRRRTTGQRLVATKLGDEIASCTLLLDAHK